jgi:putative ABC transport system permease protein
MNSLGQNLRFGLRMLAKSPGYTLVVIIALALGIGANTAIFSVVNAVLLRPLPYLDPARLVVIEGGDKQKGAEQLGGVSPANFWDLQERGQGFEQIAGVTGGPFSLTGVENPEIIPRSIVSTNFFQTVTAQPMLGRTFTPEESLVNAPGVAILSYELWQRRFGGDANIIGQRLGDTNTTVIGVMPPDFKFPAETQMWTPMLRDSGEMTNRANGYFTVLGLLKQGQNLTAAQTELQTLAAQLATQFPDANKNLLLRATPFRDRLVRDVRTALWILLGAVACVLLIACANVANLLLARAAARRKEMAVRAALGATRGQLLRQLLTESLLLSVMGGAVGLLIALWGVDLLVRLLPEQYAYLQLQDAVRVDGAVLAFTLLAVLATGLLFGLAPAWQASRIDLNDTLKEGGRNADGSGRRTRSALVVVEIALAMILLIGAGLLLQSFVRRQRAELGFDPQNLFTMNLSLPFRDYPNDAARVQFLRRVQEQVAQTPGVESVTFTTGNFPYLNFGFNLISQPLPSDVNVLYDAVGHTYFRTVKAQMISGRELDERDVASSPQVAVINEALARRFFADTNPLGQRITINYLGTRQTREIVGVVRNVNQGEPGKIAPQVYVNYQQQPWFGHALMIRAATNPAAIKNDVQRAIWAVDKKQAPAKLSLIAESLNSALAEPRLYATLLGVFAALALLLAGVGIYGVMAYTVTQRTQEIGLRVALGAQRGDVLALVVKQGMTLALIGVGLGVAGALALTRLMRGLLYNVSATDPITFVTIAALLAAVALIACYLPARRAMKVDPLVALRYE